MADAVESEETRVYAVGVAYRGDGVNFEEIDSVGRKYNRLSVGKAVFSFGNHEWTFRTGRDASNFVAGIVDRDFVNCVSVIKGVR